MIIISCNLFYQCIVSLISPLSASSLVFPISFVKTSINHEDSTVDTVFVKRMHKVTALSGAAVLIIAVWITYAAIVRGFEYRYVNNKIGITW